MAVVQNSWRRRHDKWMQGQSISTNLIQTRSREVTGSDSKIEFGWAVQITSDGKFTQGMPSGSILGGLAPMRNSILPWKMNPRLSESDVTDGNLKYTNIDTMSAMIFGEMAVRVLHDVEEDDFVYADRYTGQLTSVRLGDWVGSLRVTRAGTQYNGTETVTFSAPPAGGRRATGTLTQAAGVPSIAIDDPGDGYTSAPTVTVGESAGNGTDMTVTAVLGNRVRLAGCTWLSSVSASGLAAVRINSTALSETE